MADLVEVHCCVSELGGRQTLEQVTARDSLIEQDFTIHVSSSVFADLRQGATFYKVTMGGKKSDTMQGE